MNYDKFENLKKIIEKCAYNEEQKEEAFKQLDNLEPKIKKVISTLVYNREWGKEISVLTSPSFDITFQFKKN